MSAPTVCLRCGCCCFSAEPDYIAVYAVDLGRMSPRARALTASVGTRHAMRFAAGCCQALRRDHAACSCSCAIHAERPDACRWLVPGSSTCRDERARKAALVAAWMASAEAAADAAARTASGHGVEPDPTAG